MHVLVISLSESHHSKCFRIATITRAILSIMKLKLKRRLLFDIETFYIEPYKCISLWGLTSLRLSTYSDKEISEFGSWRNFGRLPVRGEKSGRYWLCTETTYSTTIHNKILVFFASIRLHISD